jgi:hypothetical protein
MGGDPTGIVTRIRWQSWGGKVAIGMGTGNYLPPDAAMSADAYPQRAVIVAFELGRCSGKRAYRAVDWYYPEHGERREPGHYLDACTGDLIRQKVRSARAHR